MTIREVFKKVEAYNEIAAMMGTDKAKIVLVDKTRFPMCAGSFKTYSVFAKFVKDNYFPNVAENLIKSKDWEIDGDISFKWGWDNEEDATFGIELSAI